MNALRVRWTPRDTPLEPVGMVAFGPVARRLATRCPGRIGVVTDDALVVFGTDLPWEDGVFYVGELVPGRVWCDTRLEPNVPVSLLGQWARQHSPGAFVWIPGRVRIDVRARRPLDGDSLTEWSAR